MPKSSVLSDHLSYNTLKGYYTFFAHDTKNKRPPSALIDALNVTVILCTVPDHFGTKNYSLMCQITSQELRIEGHLMLDTK